MRGNTVSEFSSIMNGGTQMSKKRKEEKQRASTRQLIGVKEISEFSIVTYEHGELVFFLI